MAEHTCDARVPADLAAGLEGDAAEPCLLDRGHDRWTAHGNAYVSWPSRPEAAVSRVELILALADNLTAEDVDLIRPFLRLAELARPTAPDAVLLADALESLDAVFDTIDGEGR